MWERIKDGAAIVFAALVGIGLAVAAFVLYFIPRADDKKRREAQAKAQTVKKQVEQRHEERKQKVDQQVAVVKEEVKVAKTQDPVDFANDLIKKG